MEPVHRSLRVGTYNPAGLTKVPGKQNTPGQFRCLTATGGEMPDSGGCRINTKCCGLTWIKRITGLGDTRRIQRF
jgi:hypothetical protein